MTEAEQLIKQAAEELEITITDTTTTQHGVSVQFNRRDGSMGGVFIRYDTPFQEIAERLDAEAGNQQTAKAAREARKAALEAELKALDSD